MALPSWVPDDETKPAPMPLLVVQSFVNTWEGDSGTDLLADPPPRPVAPRRRFARRGRSRGRGPCGAPGMREAVRSLLVHNAGGVAPDRGRSTRWGRSPSGAVCSRSCSPTAASTSGRATDRGGGLARLLLIIPDAQHDGTWGLLKACRNPDCRWAYYDRSTRGAGRGATSPSAATGSRTGTCAHDAPVASGPVTQRSAGEPHGPGRRRRQGGDARTGQRRQAQRAGRRNRAGVDGCPG